MIEKFYTTEEVAQILRVKPQTVAKWSSEGSLVPLKAGGRNLYTEDQIREFIKSSV